jgi:hypothetical protein
MAQTKKKRKTKHRGTQAGTVERAGRTSRQTRQAARTTTKKSAADKRAQRFERPPTWRSAASRAGMAAVFFGLVVVLLLHKPAVTGVAGAAFAFLFYIPISYTTDRFLYNRYQRRKRGG